MKKEDLLQPEIEGILINMNFIKKYIELFEKYSNDCENYKYTAKEIISVLDENNIKVKKYGKDQFFSDFFMEGDFLFRFGLTIKFNIIHFEIVIKNDQLKINSGTDFGLLVQIMTNWELPIKSPKFSNYVELKSLLNEAVNLYNEIKDNIINGLK